MYTIVIELKMTISVTQLTTFNWILVFFYLEKIVDCIFCRVKGTHIDSI